MKKTLLLLLLGTLSIAACTSGDSCTAGEACEYYQGSRGVIMEPQDLPDEMYFTPGQTNQVQFPVRVKNVGASDTYGGVFLTGFDPDTFRLDFRNRDGAWQHFNIARTAGCQLSTDGFGLFNPSGETPSFNFGISGDCGNGFFNIDSDGNVNAGGNPTPILEEALGIQLPDTRLNLEVTDGEVSLGVGVPGLLIDAWGHGRVLVAIASEFTLQQYNGATYILPGQNPDTPNGGEAYKTFRAAFKNEETVGEGDDLIGIELGTNDKDDWPAGTDQYRFNYRMKNCYSYTTFISPAICIDPRPQAPDEGKICEEEKTISTGTQGAPVAVTSVSQDNTGSSVIMNFEVSNVGNGRVIDVGMLQACSPYWPGKRRPSMYDQIYIGQAYIGDKPLDCGRNSIRLDNGRASFTCRYDFNAEYDTASGYERPLKMELWYGYTNEIRRSLNVKRVQ